MAAVLVSVLLAGCDVDVQDDGKSKNVKVDLPFVDVSVRSGAGEVDTGLPIYPGATAMREQDAEHDNANVDVSLPFVAVKVAAAKFESSDAPQAIADFYKEKLGAYGSVTECKGEVRFSKGTDRPYCDNQPASHEIQLVAGTEEDHRLVAVKPRGSGSEFALVSVRVGDRS
jgi:hypothetical protein